jgi:hypothetical protein
VKTLHPKVAEAQSIIVDKMAQLETLFSQPMKLTFIARCPGNPEQELVVTSDDDLDELLACIKRTKAREAYTSR